METVKSAKPLSVVIAGSLSSAVEGKGTPLSLQLLIDSLRARPDVRVYVVNLFGIRGARVKSAWRFGKACVALLKATCQADILSIHVSPTALPFLAPFALLIARILGRRFVVRMFGGFDYSELLGIRGRIAAVCVRYADLYFPETKRLFTAARDRGLRNVVHFPNNRPMLAQPPKRIEPECNRFVFLSRITATKGIRELIEAGESICDGPEIDVYGTFDGELDERIFQGLRKVRFRGSVERARLSETLSKYDVLFLPTYHEGEGYPGIILDAYEVGMPVVCTRWRSLPELVDDTSGMLIEPRSSMAIKRAIVELTGNKELYGRLCKGALRKRDYYATEKWAGVFVRECSRLVSRNSGKRHNSSQESI